MADRALREVEMAGMVDQVLFSSFDPMALERVLKKNQAVPVAYLYNRPCGDVPGDVVKALG